MDVLGQSIYDLSHPCDHDEIREMIGVKSHLSDDGGHHRGDVFVRMKSTITSKGRNVNIKSASYKVSIRSHYGFCCDSMVVVVMMALVVMMVVVMVVVVMVMVIVMMVVVMVMVIVVRVVVMAIVIVMVVVMAMIIVVMVMVIVVMVIVMVMVAVM